ncbi:Disrupted in renal carcinoma protein 2 [Amphibalanus amphitrite]|uniref:Disrupted in renal carcinoma protein 2 n=1 Tax=Amphibalanus amphitrite TaxID=1232801 RepID=A0A6A4WWN4_AMPAM|nr:Disrupted in renal carcinoma protein 2 [Amphibalanus amphitrite]KAF0311916.1 Disrupted in renal carcinoma protein 2 [Amphibalanus amphitrite]
MQISMKYGSAVMVVNADMESADSDRRPLLAPAGAAPPVVKTYKRRWYILAVYSALGFMQCAIWNTWGPITEAALVAFPGWGELTISSLTNVALIAFIVFMAPYCWLLDKKGVRPAVVLMAACLAVGTALRCITLQQPFFNIFAFVASVLTGVAGIMAMAAPPYISAMWFAPHQRTTATGVPNVLNQLGMSGSFLLGPLVVAQPSKNPPPGPPSNTTGNVTGVATALAANLAGAAESLLDESARWIGVVSSNVTNGTHPTPAELRSDIMDLMYIDAGICLVLFVMTLAYFPSRPPLPPSISASTNTVTFREGLGMAFRHPDLICIVLAYSLSQGVMGAWFGILDINVRPLGVTENEASMMGMWAGICCCAFALVVARLTDMFRGHIKATIIGLLVVGLAHWCWLLAIVAGWAPFSNVHLFCAVLVAICCTYAASPLLFEYASEVSYPIPEDVVGATMSFTFNLVGMLYLLFFLNKRLAEQTVWLNYCLVVATAIPIVLMLRTKSVYRRSAVDDASVTAAITESVSGYQPL